MGNEAVDQLLRVRMISLAALFETSTVQYSTQYKHKHSLDPVFLFSSPSQAGMETELGKRRIGESILSHLASGECSAF